MTDQEKDEVVSLKIKTEKGKRTLIIKLLKNEKISKLYEITDKYRYFNFWIVKVRAMKSLVTFRMSLLVETVKFQLRNFTLVLLYF